MLSFCVAIPPFFTQTLCFSLLLIPKTDLCKTSSSFLLSQQGSTEGVMTSAFCFLTGPFSVGLRDCICHEVSGSPYNELCVGCRVDCAEVDVTLSTADPVSSLTCPSWETEGASFHLAPGTRMSFRYHKIRVENSLKQNLSKRKLQKQPRLWCLKSR